MANMTLRTYRAPTMGEALTQVKKDLGKDAVILHTRAFRAKTFLGLFGKPMVEITASVGVNVVNPLELRRRTGAADRTPPISTLPTATSPTASAASAAATPSNATSVDRSALRRAYGAAGGTPAHSPVSDSFTPSATTPRPVATAPASREADLRAAVARANGEDARTTTLSPNLHEELAAIKCMVAQVLQSSARGAAEGATGSGGGAGVGFAPPSVAMPEALLKFYLKLIQNDVSREIADRVASAIRDELSPPELADESIVRQSVLRHVESLIPTDAQTVAPASGPDGGPFVLALVGPTGVGKTTTIAKLAAAYRLRHGKRVALITADTYRIAAVDQLRTYAGIIGVPLHVAHTPDQMAAAVDACTDFDVVLIDTAGRSPGDSQRLDELQTFLAAARPHQVHLVLASVASEASLLRTADQFARVGPSRVIFTKLDEAASFGVLVNVAARLSSRLSFVTTGQEVPDDIEPGRADRLARLILDGRPTVPATRLAPAASATGDGNLAA